MYTKLWQELLRPMWWKYLKRHIVSTICAIKHENRGKDVEGCGGRESIAMFEECKGTVRRCGLSF